MLVLTRKRDEAIIVGEHRVVIVEIRGDKVRLGVEAAPQVPVHRQEVWEEIHGRKWGQQRQG